MTNWCSSCRMMLHRRSNRISGGVQVFMFGAVALCVSYAEVSDSWVVGVPGHPSGIKPCEPTLGEV